MSVGIYIHVPFCLKKCPYCDFYSVKYNEDIVNRYVDAVCRNVEKYKCNSIVADTVYFGGGTPSLLNTKQVNRILKTVGNSFVLNNAEITLEANPCSVSLEKLKGYRCAGVNRVSFGIQSADINQLRFIGRLHDFDVAKKAVIDSRKAGIANISCDIMLGLPYQDINSLNNTLEQFTALPIEHISAYMLKIEEGTPFYKNRVQELIPDEDLQCDMYLKTVEYLANKGFEQYEISNFAKNSKYSCHNLKYWQSCEYIGIGPAAHSFFNNKRFYVPKSIDDFIDKEFQTEITLEENPDKLQEYIIFSLRLKWGINFEKLCEMSNRNRAESIMNKANDFEKQGLCRLNKGVISLTPKGYLVSNAVISEFLSE